MPKRRLILGILAVALVAALIIASAIPHEPSYEGRSLSQWLGDFTAADAAVRDRAEQAIRRIGPQAVPSLLDFIQDQRPVWRQRFSGILTRLPSKALRERVLADTQSDLLERRGTSATRAFKFLANEATAAKPQLVRLLNSATDRQVFARAAIALAYLGREGSPPLAVMLTNCPQLPLIHEPGVDPNGARIIHTNSQLTRRVICLDAISHMETNGEFAMPLVIAHLKDTNGHVVVRACWALNALRLQPQLAVPALTEVIQRSTDPEVRGAAAFTLGEHGKDSRSAVPGLMSILNEPEPVMNGREARHLSTKEILYFILMNRELRRTVTNAFLKIAPEVLTNAPVRAPQ